jgi:hypothetical protein
MVDEHAARRVGSSRAGPGFAVELRSRRKSRLIRGVLELRVHGRHTSVIEGHAAYGDESDERKR